MDYYSPGSYEAYWTQSRLIQLANVMLQFAQQDGDGWYFGPRGIAGQLFQRLRHLGFTSPTTFSTPLQLLVHVGVLEPGKRGTKTAEYQRRFYPERLENVTNDQISAAYRTIRWS